MFVPRIERSIGLRATGAPAYPPPSAGPKRDRCPARHRLGGVAVVLAAVTLSGCLSPKGYREQADDVAYNIIEQKQQEALGRTEDLGIESPELTLRRRLIEAQALPVSNEASLGRNRLDPIEHWPEDPDEPDSYLARGEGEMGLELGQDPTAVDEALRLSLADALRVAARNNRDYQSEKEGVFSTALALDLQRDEFRFELDGSVDTTYSFDGSAEDESSSMATQTQLSFERRLKNGMSVTAALGYDIARVFNNAGPTSRAMSFDTSITVPLLRGAGVHIVTEPLIQAERDTIYSIWGFERFKKTFAVSIASDYLSVLQSLDNLNNQRENYRRLVIAARRARNLAALGRLPEIQVDQAEQDELRARQSWISAQQSYARSLDRFKDRLGLPTDARIELDREELERLGESARRVLAQMEPELEREINAAQQARESQNDEQARDPGATPGSGQSGMTGVDPRTPGGRMDPPRAPGRPSAREQRQLDAAADAPVELMPPDTQNRGPLELEEADAVSLAFDHRLDLRVAQGRVFDAQRDVVVRADGFLPELTLGGSYSSGGSRGSRSYDADDDADLAPARSNVNAILNLDLPLERTAERNAYRNAYIRLERRLRDLQSLEDDIKFAIRESLRSLLQSRESLRIQARSLLLARRRVDSTNLFLELGRTEIRDLLEAQEDLVNAQNALTDALVSYRVAELNLQRDMGVLEVSGEGLWREYDPSGQDRGEAGGNPTEQPGEGIDRAAPSEPQQG